MKKLLFVACLVFSGLNAISQSNYPTPEYSNVPMFYDSKSNNLFPIEKLLFSKALRPTSPISNESYIFVDGSSSKIRFSSNSTISFITKLKVTDIDPSEYVMVLKFKVNNKKNISRREHSLFSSNAYYSQTNKPEIVNCSYKKLGDGLIMMTFSNLVPGEYFFNYSTDGNYVYCFGIDPN